MLLHVIAAYSADIPELQGRQGVIVRRARDGIVTAVECAIVTEQGRSFARPKQVVPEGLPAPAFTLRFAVFRREIATHGVGIVVQPDDRKTNLDPEQRLMAPRYAGDQRIYYEFQRGEVMFVSPKGDVEVRLVAVDSQTGEVGTRTVAHFHTRYFGLVARCEAELRGTGQLFPPPSRTSAKRFAVPKGEVNLRFGREPRELPDDEIEGDGRAEHFDPSGEAAAPSPAFAGDPDGNFSGPS
ncbi:MAG: hypothetical protein IT293_19305 [Deltaproteobacteria bacterium]|nr:hypothetical protein [Deltaproteobacteria bacterium]